MNDLKILLSCPPEFIEAASKRGPVSAMAYRVGRGFHLYRTPLPEARISVMDVDCTGFTGYGPHQALAAEMTRECRVMGYEGISLDLPRPTPQTLAFCACLARACLDFGLALYLPEAYASVNDSVMLVLPAQNLSGTFRDRMERLCARCGPHRLAPELDRVTLDFPLPARVGRGAVLTESAAAKMGPGPVFYSQELCVNYRSCLCEGRAHLIMFDDARSLREKLAVMSELGISQAFLYYPHGADILGDIIL